MTNSHPQGIDRLQDLYGRRVAARLSEGERTLPHDVSERLRAARVRAVSRRKREVTVPVHGHVLAGAGASLGFGNDGLGLWGRLASALPMIVLVAGLVTLNLVNDDLRASEVAEVDAALLTDDLPPAAYADPGFVQFLKTDH